MATRRVDFVWGHGSGNGFPVVDGRGQALDDGTWATIARALSDRRGPVGGDGLLILTEGDEHHAFGQKMFNSDGSESELCLNGVRLVARLGFELTGEERVDVKLIASSVAAVRDGELAPGVYTVRTTAGPAELDVTRWPLTGAGHEIVERRIDALGSARAFTAVAMPNPHLIAFVDTIDDTELVRVGSACEAAPEWLPNRANVSFVTVGDEGLYVRTHERGVGLTDSCGSAMAASTFAACLTGRAAFGAELIVRNRGGFVRASASADGMVTVSGNATFEWAGSAEVDLARGTAGDVQVTRHFNEEIAAWAAAVERYQPAAASAAKSR